MGPRSAAGDHHPVQVVLQDLLPYLVLGVLATCVEVLLGVGDTGQCPDVLHDPVDVYDAPDVDAAVADEHPDAGLHAGYVLLRRVLHLCDQLAPLLRDPLGGFCSRSAGLGHAVRDVLGSLEGAAHIDSRPRGLQRLEEAGLGETVPVELDARGVGQLA